MRMVRVLLTGQAGAPAPAALPSLIHDLLWAHAVPADNLEHARIRPLPDGLDVVLFLKAPTDEVALGSAGALLERVREPFARHGLTGGIAR
ncbi:MULTISPECIES: hypothetical protein [Streptomyces]|uniref:Uncharacterized protein n=2 Tax=Streptomyces TaxID=1883 RepID=A0ABU4K4Y9_9ACTN|nr:hypothetical protein [Streptomyces roseolus]MDX2292800.1 hypothetical protein [Streptomyces roseolus]